MERSTHELESGRFDLLIIGGGITGAGIALDASLRGLRVALVEKGDFASGTSSASSKLIHGGLRYLEQFSFGLVREALHERHTLLHIAPHLVQPLPILIPHGAKSKRNGFTVRIGLTLYDWLAGKRNIGKHQSLSMDEFVKRVPQLKANLIRRGFAFYDSQMNDARLCLEVILSARQQGAAVANYVELVSILRNAKEVAIGAVVQDHVAQREFEIRADHIVNATGPWCDRTLELASEACDRSLKPSKGVHILLPGIGLDCGLLLEHPRDGRVSFVLPWMNRTLVGTTDTFTPASPDELAAKDEDIAYLLELANHFIDRSFSETDVISTMVGLRPLLGGTKGSPSSVSREYNIFRGPSEVWTITGGKYTTYRSMAEAMVDRVVRESKSTFGPCSSAEYKLIGTPEEPWQEFVTKTQKTLSQSLGESLAAHVIARYGKKSDVVARTILAASEGSQPIAGQELDCWGELIYQREHEMALRESDHLLRRMPLGHIVPDVMTEDTKTSIRDYFHAHKPTS